MEIKVTIPDIKKNDLTLKRMELLEKRFDQQYKLFIDRFKTVENKNSKSETKPFLTKIDSLENAIRGITLKTKNNISQNNNGKLYKAFESFFVRMERLIKEVRPRLMPSPS